MVEISEASLSQFSYLLLHFLKEIYMVVMYRFALTVQHIRNKLYYFGLL